MHDISTASAPINIRNLFTKTSSVHSYNTCFSTSNNFYTHVKPSKLEIQKKSLSRIGTKLWNETPCSLRELQKYTAKCSRRRRFLY